MPKQTLQQGKRWYVLHTYSGYEENVARNLKQRIESLDMGDKIFNVLIPTETKIKIKNGKRTNVTEKIFPGYVLVEMIVTDDSWYVVRNTPNVTGFIGAGTTPTPISESEVKELQKRMGVTEPKFKIDISVDAPVKIVDGPFKEFEGKVSEVDEARGKIKVLVSMFGRETPVELDFLQ
ncbi:MAG: transcription termination/antitermination protein NusG, partial [Candidatus Komeilibacteria bacterium]|nr:transcription termination/antitermination protein NusG [Candidatus Komeilibacteria bacterium]